MSMVKYRIHEVAKDFNVTSKVISQILTDYIAAPKNHMQVLETNELDVIFEYMTQHNQAASLQDIFNTPAKAEPAKEKPAKTSEKNERQTPTPKNPDSSRRRRRQQRAETPHQQQSERDNNRRRQLGERLRKSIGDCEMSAGQLPAVRGVETIQILRRYQGRSLSFFSLAFKTTKGELHD